MAHDPKVLDEIVESLRLGEVPNVGLDLIGTGIDDRLVAFERELPRIEQGAGRIRFIRGDFGTGKTFFLKAFAARANAAGFATAYVRVSYPDLPLRSLALYSGVARNVRSRRETHGFFRNALDRWLFRVGERVQDATYGKGIAEIDPGYADAVTAEMRVMLGGLFDRAPNFAQALAAYGRALDADDADIARGLLQWLAGDPHVAADVKRFAHLRGALNDEDALPMFSGLTTVLTQSGSKGLVVLIDEAERVLRQPLPATRMSAYTTLQNLIGALGEELHHMLVVVSGTSDLFDSQRGFRALEPLRQRVDTTFEHGGFEDLDAVQVRLPPFDRGRLVLVGHRIRELYIELTSDASLTSRVDDDVLGVIADDTIGAFGGRVAIAPRQFFRETVSVLSRARQHPDFDPRTYHVDAAALRSVTLDEREVAAIEDQPALGALDI